ncbi:MAG: phage tail protein [Pseudomonas sp.]|uniref:phage tail protein n=1 Tax=Pseudomonas sp. TaxID=306 RepID=UPI003D0DFDCE
MDHYYHHPSRSFFNTATYTLGQIPEGAVKISARLKEQLLEGERTGRLISVDASGMPQLVDPLPDLLAPLNIERSWRDTEIGRIAWLRDRHRDELDQQLPTTLDDVRFAELLAYIQQLRDWPQSDKFPDLEQRPVIPLWLVDQST